MQENIKSHDGELTYEGLFEMKYLDKVVSGKIPESRPARVLSVT